MSMNGLKYICLACIIPFLPSCIQEEHTGDAGDDGRDGQSDLYHPYGRGCG